MKKIVSLLLVLAMCLALLPVAALADGPEAKTVYAVSGGEGYTFEPGGELIGTFITGVGSYTLTTDLSDGAVVINKTAVTVGEGGAVNAESLLICGDGSLTVGGVTLTSTVAAYSEDSSASDVVAAYEKNIGAILHAEGSLGTELRVVKLAVDENKTLTLAKGSRLAVGSLSVSGTLDAKQDAALIVCKEATVSGVTLYDEMGQSQWTDFSHDETFVFIEKNEHDVSVNKWVRFVEGPQGPAENQYCLRYSDVGSVSGVDSEAVQNFTKDVPITWALTYPSGAEKLYCVEVNVFGDPGNHLEYRDGSDDNSDRIAVDNNNKTLAFTPDSTDPFEVIIHWTEQDFYNNFGNNPDEEIQLQCRVLNGFLSGTGIDAPWSSYHDEVSDWNFIKINVPKNTPAFELTFANNENYEFDKAEFYQDGQPEAITTVSENKYTWAAADFGKELNVYFKQLGPSGGDDIEVIFRGCKSVSGNVVTYTVGETDVAITVGGADVQNADDRYKVLVPRGSESSVTFTVDSNFNSETMQVALHGDQNFGTVLELTNSATSLAAHNGGLPDWVNFEIEAKGGPAPGPGGEDVPWYTVSWAGGNVAVENGQVLAERVHVAATTTDPAITYTVIEDEVDKANNIYDLWETIGASREELGGEHDALELFGLGFSQSDLFIKSGLGGVSIDYRFIPAYGYQLKNIYTNESQQDSCLNAFTTDDANVSAFTFDVTEVDQNVHFCVYFEEVADTVSTDDAASISAASISDGVNAASSGILSLTVADTDTDTTIENAVGTVNLTLDNVVSKGGENGSWTTNITEFEDPITLALTLDKAEFTAADYSIVRDHDGVKEDLNASYDASTGVLTFQTNQFSAYTIVEKEVQEEPSPVVTPVVTVPVSGSENSVSVKAAVSGNTAVLEPLKEEEIKKVIGSDAGTGMVEIDLSSTGKTVSGVRIPTETVEAIAEAAANAGSDTAGLRLELSGGTLEIDVKTLQTILEAAEGAANVEINFDEVGTSRLNAAQKSAVSGMEVLKGYEAYITVKGQRVSDFKGGTAALYIPCEISEESNKAGFTVWFVAEDGTLEKMNAAYDGENQRFVVSHFSDYVLTYDETVGQFDNCPKDKTCPMSGFTDLDLGAWYHDGVHYCLDRGLMAGKGGGKFAPSGTTTRAQIAQILYNLEGQPAFMNDNIFSDVAPVSWYEKAVVWAQGKGIAGGYPDGTFKPDAPITREQLAVILYNYAQYKGIDVSVDENTNFLSFNDFWDVSEWAKPAMMWAIERELIVGSNWNLKPQGEAVRAQAATMLCKFCETVVE